MIHFFAAVLVSVSANLDNFVIGMTFGAQQIKISLRSNLLIATMTTVSTLFSMWAGRWVSVFLPARFPNYIGAGALMLLALYYVVESVNVLRHDHFSNKVSSGNPEELMAFAELSDSNHDKTLDAKESATLSVGLVLNNIGAGIASSITGVSIPLTASLSFAFSLFFLRAGIRLGSRLLGKILGKYASLTAGILLALLAMIEWVN